MSRTIHKPVLLKESLEGLNLKKGAVVVDATLGGGGHSREILKIIGKEGMLIGIDADSEAIERFQISDNILLVNDNFSNLENILKELKIDKVDAILADLGFSSDQMENAERGFSFQKDAELDMRFSLRIANSHECTKETPTAKEIVNNYSEEELTRILKEYGEERFAKSIARKICEIRKSKEIRTTTELAEIIVSATPKKYKFGKIHPATRTFQALRIEVNQELENLKKFAPAAIAALNSGGRLAIISFHSLEDRIVKNIFRENARGCICPANFPICRCEHEALVKVVSKKPIVPSAEEVESNPRSRSAKLRIAEKI